ncbi:hypothetical protein MnBA_40710 [Marinobacterium sp. BA1]
MNARAEAPLSVQYINKAESLAKQCITNQDRWSPDDVMNTAESIDIHSTFELGSDGGNVRVDIVLSCEFSFDSEDWTQGVVQIHVPSIETQDDAERLLTHDAREAIRHQLCEAVRFYGDMIKACEVQGLPVPHNPEIRVHFCQGAVRQAFQADNAHPAVPEVKTTYEWNPVRELHKRLGLITTPSEAAVALDDFLQISGLHDGLARSMTADEIMYDLKLSGRAHEAELIEAVRERIQMPAPCPETLPALDAAKAAVQTIRDQNGVDISVRHDGADIVGEIELASRMLPNGIMFEGSALARLYDGRAIPKVEMLIEPEVFDASINHVPTQMAVRSAVEHLKSFAAGSTYDPAQIEQVWVKGIPDNHMTDDCPITAQVDAFVNRASMGEIRDTLVAMAKRLPPEEVAEVLPSLSAEHDPLAPQSKLTTNFQCI